MNPVISAWIITELTKQVNDVKSNLPKVSKEEHEAKVAAMNATKQEILAKIEATESERADTLTSITSLKGEVNYIYELLLCWYYGVAVFSIST